MTTLRRRLRVLVLLVVLPASAAMAQTWSTGTGLAAVVPVAGSGQWFGPGAAAVADAGWPLGNGWSLGFRAEAQWTSTRSGSSILMGAGAFSLGGTFWRQDDLRAGFSAWSGLYGASRADLSAPGQGVQVGGGLSAAWALAPWSEAEVLLGFEASLGLIQQMVLQFRFSTSGDEA